MVKTLIQYARQRRRNAAALALGVTVVVAALIVAGQQYLVLERLTDSRRAELVSELSSLTPPAGARDGKLSSEYKPGHALATASYGGSYSLADLRQHYDSLLAVRGWRYLREEQFADGEMACFARGDSTAGIETRPSDERFSVFFEWGSSQTCR